MHVLNNIYPYLGTLMSGGGYAYTTLQYCITRGAYP